MMDRETARAAALELLLFPPSPPTGEVEFERVEGGEVAGVALGNDDEKVREVAGVA